MNIIIKKYAIYIVIVLAAFFAGIYFVGPVFGELLSSNSTIVEKNEKIKEIKHNIEMAKQAQARAMSKDVKDVKIEKLIFESEYNSSNSGVNFNSMLETVLELAKQAGIKVKNIEFKNAPESDAVVQNHSQEYEVTLLSTQLIGTYTQLQSFMREIYRHQYLMGIKDFKITPYEFDKKILIVDLSLSLYMKK